MYYIYIIYYVILYKECIITWLLDRNAVRLNFRGTSYPKQFALPDLMSTRNCRIHNYVRIYRENTRDLRSDHAGLP